MVNKDVKKTSNLPFDMIEKLIENIKFGAITIVIQDGKVVQIESNEKYRIKE